MPDAVAAAMVLDPAPGHVFAQRSVHGGYHLPDMTLVSRTAPASQPRGPTTQTSEAWSPRVFRPTRARCTRKGSSSRRSGSTTRSSGCCREYAQPSGAPGGPGGRARGPQPRRARIEELACSMGAIASRRRWTSCTHFRTEVRPGCARVLTAARRLPTSSSQSKGSSTSGARILAGEETRSISPARRPRTREPQLSARRRPLGLLLRRSMPHSAGEICIGWRVRAVRGLAPGAVSLTRARPPRSSRATPRRRGVCGCRRPRLGEAWPVPQRGRGR